MIPPDVEWDRFPMTLVVTDLAVIYAMKPDTLRKQVRLGDTALPAPFADRPWRWRKAEVRRHYERLTLGDVRAARRLRRRELDQQQQQVKEATPA